MNDPQLPGQLVSAEFLRLMRLEVNDAVRPVVEQLGKLHDRTTSHGETLASYGVRIAASEKALENLSAIVHDATKAALKETPLLGGRTAAAAAAGGGTVALLVQMLAKYVLGG